MDIEDLESILGYHVEPWIMRDPPDFDYSLAHDAVDNYILTGEGLSLIRQGEPRYPLPPLPPRENDNYRVALLPIGYAPSSIPKRFNEMKTILGMTYEEFGVEFTFPGESISVALNGIERLLVPNNEQAEAVLGEYSAEADGLLFCMNTRKYGGSGGKFPLIASPNRWVVYLSIHELGHHFGLDDGYNRFYPPGEFNNSSELFTDIRQLSPEIEGAFSVSEEPVCFTGSHYDGTPVYSFDPGKGNIMKDWMFPAQIVQRLVRTGSVFSEMQKHIIQATIDKRIEER